MDLTTYLYQTWCVVSLLISRNTKILMRILGISHSHVERSSLVLDLRYRVWIRVLDVCRRTSGDRYPDDNRLKSFVSLHLISRSSFRYTPPACLPSFVDLCGY